MLASVVKDSRAVAAVVALLAVWAGSALAATPRLPRRRHAALRVPARGDRDEHRRGRPGGADDRPLHAHRPDARSRCATARPAAARRSSRPARTRSTRERAPSRSRGRRSGSGRPGSTSRSCRRSARTLLGRRSSSSPGPTRARVLDPCALVGSSRRRARPATTPAPWPLPRYALSHIGRRRADAAARPRDPARPRAPRRDRERPQA